MIPWVWFLIAAAVAVAVVLWRLVVRREPTSVGDDLAINRALYLEKLALLQRQRDDGEISDARYRELELEHQRQFLADNPPEQAQDARRGGAVTVLIVALLVPVLAGSLYAWLGADSELRLRALLDERASLMTSAEPDPAAVRSVNAAIIDRLSALTERSDKPVYPVLLARLYQQQGAYGLAAENYRKAAQLVPEDGGVRAEYAQALYFEAGNRMTPEVEKATDKALSLAPDDPTALGLKGIAGFQAGEPRAAIDYWRRALKQLPPGASTAQALRNGIAAAREQLGEDAPDPASKPDSTDGAGLQVRVEAPDVQAPAETTVFVYAREWEGSPMPLAIRRLSFGDLPASVTLDDSMAMGPGARLSGADEVEVVARVSLSGKAAPASGDFQGSRGPLTPSGTEQPVRVTIDRRIP